MDQLTFYEFFAGGGMARAGLGSKWDCVFANDFDEKKVAAYKANWGDDSIEAGDVAGIAPFQLPGHADLAWASFPCQDLSLAGNGGGLGAERSGSFWGFWKLIEALRKEGRAPSTVVLENVCGLITSSEGRDFTELCRAIYSSGYIFGAVIADAIHFLPQSRPRLFIVCYEKELSKKLAFVSDEPSKFWHTDRLIKAQKLLPEAIRNSWRWFDPPVPKKSSLTLSEIITDHPEGVEWHSEKETHRLISMMNPRNRAKLQSALDCDKRIIGAIYKRTRSEAGKKLQRAEIRLDGNSGCLRTPGGGSSRQIIVSVNEGIVKTRLISARETAILMGLTRPFIEKNYILPEKYNDAYHLTGDGVCVPVVKYLADHLLLTVLEPAELKNAA